MSNHRTREAILLHHKQKADAQDRRAVRSEERRLNFENTRSEIKARITIAVEEHEVAVMIFCIGCLLMAACIGYALGAMLYG